VGWIYTKWRLYTKDDRKVSEVGFLIFESTMVAFVSDEPKENSSLRLDEKQGWGTPENPRDLGEKSIQWHQSIMRVKSLLKPLKWIHVHQF